PAAIAGFGLGWLAWNGRRHSHEYESRYERGEWRANRELGEGYSYGEPVRSSDFGPYEEYEEPGMTDRLRERAGDLGENVRERTDEFTDRTREALSDVGHRARERVGHLAHRTKERSHRLEDRFEDMMEESPF